MKFENLIHLVAGEPVFETGLLLAGDMDPLHTRRQLSRWVKAGKLYQLRRGVYALAPPFGRVAPHPFFVANVMVSASYVSAQSALAYYGLIPEMVPVVVSITRCRPGEWQTALGRFTYRHIKAALFTGYNRVDLGNDQYAFVAMPEKALLDLIYLEPGGDTPTFLESLRLQRMERLDLGRMQSFAEQSGVPKLRRTAKIVAELAAAEAAAYTDL